MKKGFSLIEVMIALGVLAVASVGVMKISTNTAKVQKRAETFQNILTLEQRVRIAVSSPNGCENTLAPAGNNTITNNKILNRIADSNNNDLFVTGQTYYNNTIRVDRIRLINYTPAAAALGQINGLVDIEVQYTKSAATLDQNNQYLKVISGIIVVVEDDGAGTFINCSTPINQAVEDALAQICGEVGGFFNPISRTCDSTDGAIDPSPGSSQVPGSQASILDNRFVSRMGDNIVGPAPLTIGAASGLVVNSATVMNGTLAAARGINIPTGQTVCFGPDKCIDFSVTCATPSAFRGYDENGNIQCVLKPSCDDETEFIAGYLPSGEPICKKTPFSECGTGQYAQEIKADGTVVCDDLPPAAYESCRPYQELMGYLADGRPDCVDKKCAEGENLDGYDATGTPQCSGGSDPLEGIGFMSMYVQADGSLTATPPESTTQSFELNNRRCGANSSEDQFYRCEVGQSEVTCPSSFVASNPRTINIRESALNQACRCEYSCVADQESPIEVAFRQCTAEQGDWRTSSYGSCSCPGYDPSSARAPANGTESLSVTCIGDKCGAGCDEATKPESTRACTCYPCQPGDSRFECSSER